MDIFQAIEIFAFATGLLYVVLEILQRDGMWVVGILTGAACAWSFGAQHVYASAGLNIYYVIVSVIGLRQWKKDSGQTGSGTVHLRKPTGRTVLVSLAALGIGTLALALLLRRIGGTETGLDAAVTVLSAVATWWLARSYAEQWLLWIVADLLSATLCLAAGLPWMAVLYLAYAAAAVYGYRHWKRNGTYIS